MPTYEFVQLDVFTRTPLTGNPLAVFTDATGMSDGQMQALAREMNLSETTFILPRPAPIEAESGVKVRIFTVGEELPFAGHPTLGTALHLHAIRSGAVDQIDLDLKVGKIPVRFKNEGKSVVRVDGSVFGEMRQRDPEFGAILPRNEVAQVIGLATDDLHEQWPVQTVSTGLPFTIVPIRDRAVLSNLKLDVNRATTFLNQNGGRFFYFVCPERDDTKLEVRARMFFYGGEDPATGSAAGNAASWMVNHGVAKNDEPVLIRQGVEMQRPSEIYVRATNNGGNVTDVFVGGYAVEVLRGMVTL
jgi:trans-2,3-dihydro-3-hydroxyanthranilate isomerase